MGDCDRYLPEQSKWPHDRKVELAKKQGHANKSFFDAMYTHLDGLARDLKLADARFAFALSSVESGWLNEENTWLNNPFGLTSAGRDNLGFDTLIQAVSYWRCKFGDSVQGARTMDSFMGGLRQAKYNKDPAYFDHGRWEAQLHSVSTWGARFGYDAVTRDEVVLLLPRA